jgi:hypothetical protein
MGKKEDLSSTVPARVASATSAEEVNSSDSQNGLNADHS